MTTGFQPTVPEPIPPQTRRPKTPKPRPEHCVNCKTPAIGKFCAECGQEIKDHSVALGPLLSEGLAELASWDSKLLRTLVPLLIRPGFLTNEYHAGRRVPYLSPLKLYLTLSVLFFLLLAWKPPISISGSKTHVDIMTGRGRGAKVAANAAEYDAGQKALPPAKRDTIFRRALKRGALKAKQSPESFVSTLIGDIPKMMFFLLPLFAVSLKLLYWRPKRLYVEHLIFLLHVHAFAFLLLTPLLLVHPPWLVGSVSLALTVYVLAAMRVVYKQSWPATLFKFSLLGFGYILLLSLCIVGTLLVALWLL